MGKRVLHEYLKLTLPAFDYLGIDISENAVSVARNKFRRSSFLQMDFGKVELDQKFDIIIFNEAIEYFNRPLHKLKQCVDKNLLPGGQLIVSMYKGHDRRWKTMREGYDQQCI